MPGHNGDFKTQVYLLAAPLILPAEKRNCSRQFTCFLIFCFCMLILSNAFATAPVIGLTTFNNAFSGTTNLLPSTPSSGTVDNVGNGTEATGILATGWDFSITTPGSNVSMSASAAGANPGGVSDYCIRMSSLTFGITVQSTRVKSDDGSAFYLQYVYLKINITAGAPANMIIKGYRSGVAVVGASLTVNGIASSTWTKIDVSAITAFEDIDEFEFTQSGTSSATVTYEVVDQIDIASPVTLPLTLINFSGRLSGSNVVLSWTTLSEQNTSHFEVQRSVDDTIYTAIGQLAAAGNSALTLHYQYIDVLSFLPGSNIFYRLKMVDQDGHFLFSPVAEVTVSSIGNLSLSVYPNPFHQSTNLFVGISEPDNAIVTIFNTEGKVLLRQNFSLQKGANILSLPDLGKWEKAVYYLNIATKLQKQTISLVKME
jgi:hypothetical protein